MKQVLLEGYLGEKYGRNWEISANSYQQIFACIDANYPGFQQDLVDLYESGGDLSIISGSQMLEEVEELFYPISEETIIISPIPAGSKSGAAKIIIGVLLIASLFIPGSGAILASIAATTPLSATVIALTVASIGINLAIAGLQQLLAPDPSVDEKDQDYLFSGPENVVAQGGAVPILFGEMIIGGIVMSSAIIPGLASSYGHVTGLIPGTGGIGTLPGGSFGGDAGGFIAGYFDERTVVAGESDNIDPDLILYSADTIKAPWAARGSREGIAYLSPVIPHEIPEDLYNNHRLAITSDTYKDEVDWSNFTDVVVGTLPVTGNLYKVLDGVSLSSSVTVFSDNVEGYLNITLDGIGLEAEASSGYVATLTSTLDPIEISSSATYTGLAEINATLAATLDSIQLSSNASSAYVATLASTLDGIGFSSNAMAEFLANSSITFDGIQLSSDATFSAGGPSFPSYTIHAWDPDAGSNSSGYVPDAVGSAPLYAANGTSSVANWDGEIDAGDPVTLVALPGDLSTFRGDSSCTITAWIMFRSGSGTYSGLISNATAQPVSGGAQSGWFIRREDGSGYQWSVRFEGYGGTANVSGVPSADTWVMLTLRLGSSQWRAFRNDRAASADLSWSGTAKADITNVLKFGGYPVDAEILADNVGDSGDLRARFGDIRVHDKILSDSEIDDLYTAGRQSY